MPGLSQLDSQHCGLCAVWSIDAFTQTSNDSDIKALEISAQNAARLARQGPIQRMPSRALDGSHGQQDHASFFRWSRITA